jgi:hypothetical protein
MAVQAFTAVIHNEDDLYVADCPEVGTVSQGSLWRMPPVAGRCDRARRATQASPPHIHTTPAPTRVTRRSDRCELTSKTCC